VADDGAGGGAVTRDQKHDAAFFSLGLAGGGIGFLHVPWAFPACAGLLLVVVFLLGMRIERAYWRLHARELLEQERRARLAALRGRLHVVVKS